MKLPKSIKIANHTFKIVQMKKDIASLKRRFGECDCDNLEIRVAVHHKDSHVYETLIHEIFHAIYWSYNIKENDDEERTVTAFGIGWSQVLNTNKSLRKFIKSESK